MRPVELQRDWRWRSGKNPIANDGFRSCYWLIAGTYQRQAGCGARGRDRQDPDGRHTVFRL